MEVITAAAERFAEGGYEVFLDGVIGPWFLEPFLALCEDGLEVHYIVLRPNEQTAVSRVKCRNAKAALDDTEVTRQMWRAFSDLGEYETHVIDTSRQSIEETAEAIGLVLAAGTAKISTGYTL